MDAMTVGIDLAKDVFELAIAGGHGQVRTRRRVSRRQFAAFVDALPAGSVVVMEACGTAQYWARRCQARGADVRLLPAQYVRPYVRRNKTDRADAEALLEAHRCGGIQPVPVKSVEQQTIQALHRVRQHWQRTRTARINVLRALLREHGITFPTGSALIVRRIAAVLADPDAPVPALLRSALMPLLDELRAMERQLAALDRQLALIARTHPVAQRLQQIPGIGVITATALLGSVPHIHAFRRARQFASWVGLTPRESSSGMRRTLGRISKQGDPYLRMLLVHGARSVLRVAELRARQGRTPAARLPQWALATAHRRGRHRTIVAIANKTARIVWAMWTRGCDFAPDGVTR